MQNGLPPSDIHRWDSFVWIVYAAAAAIFGGYLTYLWRLARKLKDNE